MTEKAFANALAVDMALGGRTNSILHLQAIAHEAGIRLELAAAQEASARTPNLCRLSPSGPHHVEDLYAAGGVQAVMKELAGRGLLDTTLITVTGKSVGEALAAAENLEPTVIRPRRQSLQPDGRHRRAQGQPRAPGRRRQARRRGRGHAPAQRPGQRSSIPRTRPCEAIFAGAVRRGDVVVIRYEGPRGGPGMREMLLPTSASGRHGARPVGGARHRRPLQRRPRAAPRSGTSRPRRPAAGPSAWSVTATGLPSTSRAGR